MIADSAVASRFARVGWVQALAGAGTFRGDVVRNVVPAFAISRLVVLVAALISAHDFPLQPGNGVWPGGPSTDWIAALSRWDGKWYLSITRDGYYFTPQADSNVPFSPGYPLLIRLLGWLTFRHDTDSLMAIGIVLSNAALLVALVCLYALGRRVAGDDVARRAVLWMVAFPSTVYLSAVYPESVFLAFAVGAYLLALEGLWAWAAVAAVAATLTRNYGVVLLLPLAWEYLSQKRRIGRDSAWLLLIPGAYALLQGYFVWMSGDLLVMVRANAQWGRHFIPPWDIFRYYLSFTYWKSYVLSGGALADVRSPQDLGVALLFGGLTLLSWRLRPRSLGLLATLLYLPEVSTGAFISIARLILEIFPAFLVLAQITRSRAVFWPLIAVSTTMATIAAGWFAIGGGFA